MATRKHPVAEMIRTAAYGGGRGLPTQRELDALKLSPSSRASVETACKDVAKIHDTGMHQDAWMAAEERAGLIIDALPERQQADDCIAREAPGSEALVPNHPAALARLVRGEV